MACRPACPALNDGRAATAKTSKQHYQGNLAFGWGGEKKKEEEERRMKNKKEEERRRKKMLAYAGYNYHLLARTFVHSLDDFVLTFLYVFVLPRLFFHFCETGCLCTYIFFPLILCFSFCLFGLRSRHFLLTLHFLFVRSSRALQRDVWAACTVPGRPYRAAGGRPPCARARPHTGHARARRPR